MPLSDRQRGRLVIHLGPGVARGCCGFPAARGGHHASRPTGLR